MKTSLAVQVFTRLHILHFLELKSLPASYHLPTHTSSDTRTSSRMHTYPTLTWSMHLALWKLCVMGSQQGDGSMCCRSLSVRLSLQSHIFSSADRCSLCLPQCMTESPSNLGIREALVNFIHLNPKGGGLFLFVFFVATQIRCLGSSSPVHDKQRCTVEEKGASVSE